MVSFSPDSEATDTLLHPAQSRAEKHVQSHSKDVSIQALAPGLSILSNHASLTEDRAREADGLRKESTGGWTSHNQRQDVQPLDIWLHTPSRRR